MNNGSRPEADGDDPRSWVTYRQTLRDHTDMVVDEMRALLDRLNTLGLEDFRQDLENAAAKHDWGKAHDVMQETLHRHDASPDLLAKSKTKGWHQRPHFRHELASALAMLATGDSDLAAYLAAAHHGRIRVTIRSMPGEREDGKPLVRGIFDGDVLRACEPATGIHVPEVRLSLDVMGLGLTDQGFISWTDRAIRLRDLLGPFRLAYLEMLLRSADERASDRKAKEVAACAQ